MIRYVVNIFCLFLIAWLTISCSSSKNTSQESGDDIVLVDETIIVPDTFVLPDMPAELTNADARADYLVMHYWDRFDFSDASLVDKPEITEQAFVDYVNILYYATSKKAEESLRHTLSKASGNKEMYIHFASLFEKYFYNANSPFRNEEFYIPVLQEVLKSDLLTQEQKSAYRLQQEFTRKNRVGQAANDFTFTSESGQDSKMSSINSEFLILLFTNPECSTCMAVTDMINKSEAINKAFSHNTPQRTMLTVLSVYPDDDIESWKSHLDGLSGNWIHAYDKGMQITKGKLYDLKAIPTIYLLDKNKKVILKDTSVELIEAFFELPK